MIERLITDDLIADFSAQLKKDEKSLLTIEKYKRDVNQFRAFMRGDSVEKERVLEYKRELMPEYAVSSINSIIASLNAFFRFANWTECCIKPIKVQKKAFCSAEKELTKAEYVRLVNAARRTKNSRLELILQTVCGTGIRVSELKYITVEAVRQGVVEVYCKNKIRTVFIVRELQKKLLAYIKTARLSCGCVFVTKNGRPIDRSNLWRQMKSLCNMARVASDKVFPHNLRHLFARTFYGIEKDIAKLADILGHSSINTTRIYIIATGKEHRRKMETMHLII